MEIKTVKMTAQELDEYHDIAKSTTFCSNYGAIRLYCFKDVDIKGSPVEVGAIVNPFNPLGFIIFIACFVAHFAWLLPWHGVSGFIGEVAANFFYLKFESDAKREGAELSWVEIVKE